MPSVGRQTQVAKHALRSALSPARPLLVLVVVWFFCLGSQGQETPSAAATAPQVKNVLPSYEGQPVSVVEIAGNPQIDFASLRSVLVQKEGQPFSREKIDQSIAALKTAAKAEDVQLEIRPQADGLRVLFVLQPAYSFGIYSFPGSGRFAYSRLLQVSDYPPRGAF